MTQNFAQENAESITLTQSTGSIALLFLLFLIKILVKVLFIWCDRKHEKYCKQRDRLYLKTEKEQDRQHDERLKEENQGREKSIKEKDSEREDERDERNREAEWRTCVDRIFANHSVNEDIQQKLRKVKNTFKCKLIHSKVTWLDVLRYMLTDDNDYDFESESPPLKALRADVLKISKLLDIWCALLPTGEAPETIKITLRREVKELWELVEPFLTGKPRSIALESLQCFDRKISSNAETMRATGIESKVDVKAIVPYVNSLQFGGSDAKKLQTDFPGVDKALEDCNYSEGQNFCLHLKATTSEENFQFLTSLNGVLQRGTQFARIIREHLAKHPLTLLDQISHSDNDEVILMKIVHVVRLYIHFLLNKHPRASFSEENMESLFKLHEEIMSVLPIEEQIKDMYCSLSRKFQSTAMYLPERLRDESILTMLRKLDQRLFKE